MLQLKVLTLLTLTTLTQAHPGVTPTLISKNKTISPAQPFTVGLHLKHQKDYHTYWQNPGSVGLATTIDWTLPEGFTASSIHWPYPENSLMAGHPCHGYERDTTLLVIITPPKNLTQKSITLTAKASWMACANECHPGTQTFALTLPVTKTTTPNPTNKTLIKTAQQQIPKPNPTWKTKLLSPPNSPTIKLQISPPKNAPAPSYLFSTDAQISSSNTQNIKKQKNNTYLLTLPRSEFSPQNSTHLPAILKAGNIHISINPPYKTL